MQVVPPPVSAPEQMTNLNPRLALPAPKVVAPAANHGSRSGDDWAPASGPSELQNQVVPPPVQVGNASAERRNISGAGQHIGRASHRAIRRRRGGALHGRRPGLRHGDAVSRRLRRSPAAARLPATAQEIVAWGSAGLWTLGVAAAPPSSNGGGSTSGVVVSSQPGSKVGLPGSGGSGALAMSPSGGDKAGLGGSGGGGGIGRGDGPGSGFSGPGSGAGKEGTGPGSDPMARGGISPYPGSGGAGTGTSGTPALPGVSVKVAAQMS